MSIIIISVSGSSGYATDMTERGRLPRALRGLGGVWRTGVGEREGLFSLLALAGSSFSLSLIFMSWVGAGDGAWIGALRVDFMVVPVLRRGCLRGRLCVVSSFSSEMESGSSPLYLASRTAVARFGGIGA